MCSETKDTQSVKVRSHGKVNSLHKEQASGERSAPTVPAYALKPQASEGGAGERSASKGVPAVGSQSVSVSKATGRAKDAKCSAVWSSCSKLFRG